jgi:hypothetical protein
MRILNMAVTFSRKGIQKYKTLKISGRGTAGKLIFEA